MSGVGDDQSASQISPKIPDASDCDVVVPDYMEAVEALKKFHDDMATCGKCGGSTAGSNAVLYVGDELSPDAVFSCKPKFKPLCLKCANG